jgi:hypothetical protein
MCPVISSEMISSVVNNVMEKQMNDPKLVSSEVPPRRSFFGRIAAMSAFSLFGFSPAANAQTAQADGPDWPGKLKGRHKQVFDIYEINDGYPLGFTNNFLEPNESATAVMVFRHRGTSYALNSAMWAKYKIGEAYKIIDPETKALAVKNPWLEPKPGALRNPNMAIDRLIAKGSIAGVCAVALRGTARLAAANAGVSADEAYKEMAANLIPGATLLPSGTWAVNRAQEAGCTYCAGGG